jgi:hypothetical protein
VNDIDALMVLAAHIRSRMIPADVLKEALARADKVNKMHGREVSREEMESILGARKEAMVEQAQTPIDRLLMYHDDSCGELIDATGICPKCKFHPDMQSLGFRSVSATVMAEMRRCGATFMGEHREPIY